MAESHYASNVTRDDTNALGMERDWYKRYNTATLKTIKKDRGAKWALSPSLLKRVHEYDPLCYEIDKVLSAANI